MAKRFVAQSVAIFRDGVKVRPEVGKVFDFTKEEIDSLVNSNPAAIRMPNDESAVESAIPAPAPAAGDAGAADTDTDTDTDAGKGGKAAGKGGKGGKAAKADDDNDEI